VTLPEAIGILRHARDAGDVAAVESIASTLLAEFPAEQMPLHAAGNTLLALGSLARAASTLEAALAIAPRAEIWNDLGVARQRRGEIMLAIDAYRAALGERPGYTEAAANLAAALFLTGSIDEALVHARVAETNAPETPGLSTTLALIEGTLYGFDRALVRLEAALARNPNDVTALHATIYALRQLERPAEAVAPASHLVETVGDEKAYEMLAVCLRDLGRHAEALPLLETAVARAANPATALASIGETLLDLGHIAQARDHFARAVAADPNHAGGWIGLSQVQRFAPGDRGLDDMEALLRTPAMAIRSERILLLFALGKAHLSAGNDARAFEHYAEGNRLRRESIVYDVADDERAAAAIVGEVGAATIARLGGHGFAGTAPVVVMGMPRSGTSLVEQILATLPGMYGAGELPFVRATIEARGAYPASVAAFEPADLQQLGAAYAAALDAVVPAGLRAVDKMPSNFLYAGLLHLMLPDAKLVFCTRDPLDNGLSLYTALFSGRQDFAYDLAEIGRYYRAQQRVVAHWKAVLPAHAFIEIRYEDVVTDFDATVGRLLDFCGLPWNDACRRFYETARKVTTASRIEVRQPLYRSSVGRAQRYAAYLGPLIRELADTERGES
jgi:tetratricopeptide (TPR) repeat protein